MHWSDQEPAVRSEWKVRSDWEAISELSELPTKSNSHHMTHHMTCHMMTGVTKLGGEGLGIPSIQLASKTDYCNTE